MILRFPKRNPSPLFQMMHHFGGKFWMTIQASSNRGPAKGELLQSGHPLLRAAFSKTNLLSISAKLLAKTNRRRVHQMGAPDFDDVVKFISFGTQRVS